MIASPPRTQHDTKYFKAIRLHDADYADLWSLDFELPCELSASEPPEARGLARDEVRLMVSDPCRQPSHPSRAFAISWRCWRRAMCWSSTRAAR